MTGFSPTTEELLVATTFVGGGGAALLALGSIVARKAIRNDEPPLRDAVIVAAHPDDCLLLGGEYALSTLAEGHHVSVVYTTAGDASAETEKAEVRRDEARRVWSEAGVAADRLVFLDRPQSDLGGRSLWTDADEEYVKERLRDVFRKASNGTVVIVPAAHESHVDHRATRTAAIEALSTTSSGALEVLECAEYNAVYDVIRNPRKALPYVLGSLPALGRAARLFPDAPPAGFAGGGAVLKLKSDAGRSRRKQDLVRLFSSEYNDLLERLARQPEEYRRVAPRDATGAQRDGSVPTGYASVNGRLLHWSVLALLGLTCLFLFAVMALFCSTVVRAWGSSAPSHFAVVAVAAAIAARAWTRRSHPERAFALSALALGALLSAAT